MQQPFDQSLDSMLEVEDIALRTRLDEIKASLKNKDYSECIQLMTVEIQRIRDNNMSEGVVDLEVFIKALRQDPNLLSLALTVINDQEFADYIDSLPD